MLLENVMRSQHIASCCFTGEGKVIPPSPKRLHGREPITPSFPAAALKTLVFTNMCVRPCDRAWMRACVLLTHFRSRLIVISDFLRGEPYVNPTDIQGAAAPPVSHVSEGDRVDLSWG